MRIDVTDRTGRVLQQTRGGEGRARALRREWQGRLAAEVQLHVLTSTARGAGYGAALGELLASSAEAAVIARP